VRDLNTEPSIRYIILENFSTIHDIQSVGFGDPEMIRDILTGNNLSLGGLDLGDANQVHIGGKTDIYIKGYSLTSTSVVVQNIQPIIHLREYNPAVDPTIGEETYVDTQLPVVVIDSVEVLDSATFAPTGELLSEGIDYRYVAERSDLTYSIDEDMIIVLLNPTADSGKTIRVNYQTSPEVSTIQTFVESSANRITNADLLVKHALPCLVDVDIEYKNDDPNVNLTPTIQFILGSAINTVRFSDTFEVSDVIAVLYNAGATYVKSPLTFTLTTRNVDGSLTVTTTVDKFEVGRNVALIPNNINITRLL